MTAFEGELANLEAAFRRPALSLLRRTWAPFNLAVFRTSFRDSERQVPAARLHAAVDEQLSVCARAGIETPTGPGRHLCSQWVRDQWLRRVEGPDGAELYELTSHSLEALAAIASLREDRATLGESRLTALLDSARRLAAKANPDREARLAQLDEEIAALTAERDSLRGGGALDVGTDEEMIDGFEHLQSLLAGLPGDFRRVEEAIRESHRQILAAFRQDGRPRGEILLEYLDRSKELMTETREGRAYQGVMSLLRGGEAQARFSADTAAILQHPFAEALLPHERRSLAEAPTILNRSSSGVNDARRHAACAIRDHIQTADVAEERALLRLIRRIEGGLAQDAEERGRGPEWDDLPLLDGLVTLPTFPSSLHDFGLDAPPPPLEAVAEELPPVDFAALLAGGGPRTDDVLAAMAPALRSGATVGEAFSEIPAELRRPVEVFGLIQVLPVQGGGAPVETFHTERPDGTVQVFTVPALQPPQENP